jgi:hypothetical protein
MFDFHRALPYDVQINKRDLESRRELAASRDPRTSRWVERESVSRSRQFRFR